MIETHWFSRCLDRTVSKNGLGTLVQCFNIGVKSRTAKVTEEIFAATTCLLRRRATLLWPATARNSELLNKT
jgi:hypothetical protein